MNNDRKRIQFNLIPISNKCLQQYRNDKFMSQPFTQIQVNCVFCPIKLKHFTITFLVLAF